MPSTVIGLSDGIGIGGVEAGIFTSNGVPQDRIGSPRAGSFTQEVMVIKTPNSRAEVNLFRWSSHFIHL